MRFQTACVLLLSFVGVSCDPMVFSVPTPAMEATIPTGSIVRLTFEKARRNDIVVFKTPANEELLYTFRMVAQPGDTLTIDKGSIMIDGVLTENPKTIQHGYRIKTEKHLRERHFEENGITEFYGIGDGYTIMATEEAAKKLKSLSFVKSVKKMTYEPERVEIDLYKDFVGWNRDNIGPLYLPKAGDLIKGRMLSRYIHLIKENEGVNVSGLEAYRFKESYCFVLGDNRHNALDSRYLGMIPMSKVLGPAKVF